METSISLVFYYVYESNLTPKIHQIFIDNVLVPRSHGGDIIIWNRTRCPVRIISRKLSIFPQILVHNNALQTNRCIVICYFNNRISNWCHHFWKMNRSCLHGSVLFTWQITRAVVILIFCKIISNWTLLMTIPTTRDPMDIKSNSVLYLIEIVWLALRSQYNLCTQIWNYMRKFRCKSNESEWTTDLI